MHDDIIEQWVQIRVRDGNILTADLTINKYKLSNTSSSLPGINPLTLDLIVSVIVDSAVKTDLSKKLQRGVCAFVELTTHSQCTQA